MKRLLILCTGNSARSQIAEALLLERGAGLVHAESAGSKPAAVVNPGAVNVLREHGIDWQGNTPRGLDDVAKQRWDLVITVCDNAKEACPVLPGQPAMAHWGMDDPAETQRFAEAYQLISRRVDALLALPLDALHGPELARAVNAIAERG